MCVFVRACRAYFEVEMVHGVVGGAVEGAFSGELQGIKESLTLDSEGAAQLKEGVANPTGPVIHQLEKDRKAERGN